MDVLIRKTASVLIPLFGILGLSGCQVGYLMQSVRGQFELWRDRVPFSEALQDPKLPADVKAKIQLTLRAKEFSEQSLGLAVTRNYTDYVDLHRDAVTTVVSAAPAWHLEHYKWSFPFVGEVPYKGFFDPEDAKAEQQELQSRGFDTDVRGVSAYSTLGYFRDSLLSSMTHYADHHLVNTIIHETVHATLYVPSNADFNERLASFIANQGTEKFYRENEGANSPTLLKIQNENADEDLFSQFISKEITELKSWYDSKPEEKVEEKIKRLAEIQNRFRTQVAPKLQSDLYSHFADKPLNNAKLLLYHTYVSDFQIFEQAFSRHHRNIPEFIQACLKLAKSKTPDKDLLTL